jgi:hypothetical protein
MSIYVILFIDAGTASKRVLHDIWIDENGMYISRLDATPLARLFVLTLPIIMQTFF